MKIKTKSIVIFFTSLLLSLTTCKKERDITIPVVSTSEGTDITQTSASCTAEIVSDGGSDITDFGICWDITGNPTKEGSKIKSDHNTGTFGAIINGLDPYVTYYVRAYAVNLAGTGYGNQVKFRTNSAPANLVTAPVRSISAYGAFAGGSVIKDGGSVISSRGVCWGTAPNPIVQSNSNSLEMGTGLGAFEGEIIGLKCSTTYYLRAYAYNASGVAYGNEVTFKTTAGKAIIGDAVLESVDLTAAKAIVNVIDEQGSPIEAGGFCWSETSTQPTYQDNKITGITGRGEFHFDITGLAPSTRYYIRAFATNAGGTSYSPVIIFCTDVSDVEGTTYNTVTIGNQSWMKENLKSRHFTNGDPIPVAPLTCAAAAAISTPAYLWNMWNSGNNEDLFRNTYGLYYNWYAISDNRQICPEGWHVPTNQEWVTMEKFLGTGNGLMVRTTGNSADGTGLWSSPNNATNSSNFSVLPAGGQVGCGWWGVGSDAVFWTSTIAVEDPTHLWVHMLSNVSVDFNKHYVHGSKTALYSLRCIKD